MNSLKNRSVGGQTNVHRSSMVIFTATLVGRVAGFARELAMAQYFGTSGAMDAWLMASVIPNLLFGAVNATLSATVVPVWVKSERNRSVVTASQQAFLDKLTTLTVVVGGVLVGIGEVPAGPLLHLVAPGFDCTRLSLATTMTRMMLSTLLFWSVAGVFSGALQARESYALAALTPLAVNCVRILTIVVLGPVL
jgi:putative peptidoglycan lipid II flippase